LSVCFHYAYCLFTECRFAKWHYAELRDPLFA
jgi:hypothetical protein